VRVVVMSSYSSINEVEADLFPNRLKRRIEKFFIDYYGCFEYRSMLILRKARSEYKNE
jgi:hypothetical protein